MTSRAWFRTECLVFVILMGSYAFFWHSRDWNSASRLMLTYAVVDRGTICLDGLDRQTNDIAHYRGHYYCDKLPGFSLLATVPYGLSRLILGLPPHPLGGQAIAHWPADYWVTLGTSGLSTALTAILLMRLSRNLGCSPGRAALVGLLYGLATPAYVYATLAYGHQVSAFALLGSLFLLAQPHEDRDARDLFCSGLLAAFAAVVELQVGPVSAILGLFLLVQCLTGRRRPDDLAHFGAGALVPTLILLAYNLIAFGSPLDMGYFHHATEIFAKVHNRQNPLGLQPPHWQMLGPLIWSRYRGLFFYAPILLLAVPGWWLLFARGRRGLGVVSSLVVMAVFLVNLSYPEWTGGWSTGPRLLVPLLPFAMIPVAAVLGSEKKTRWDRMAVWSAIVLGLAGGVLMLLFQGVGARVPQFVHDPLFEIVLPLWRGASPLPSWWPGERFARNLASLWLGERLSGMPLSWLAVQFLPLVIAQGLGILVLARLGRADRAIR
jgi:hypothetical protein